MISLIAMSSPGMALVAAAVILGVSVRVGLLLRQGKQNFHRR
jgi:uncharacterized protein (DUF849 family)